MTNFLLWNSVSRDQWTYQYRAGDQAYLVYRITRLPDFTEPRFEYLCKEADGRQKEIALKQLSMLRQLHGLGDQWAMSLRLVKKEQRIILYLVFRYAGHINDMREQLLKADQKIQNALMKQEYSFEKIKTEFGRFFKTKTPGSIFFKGSGQTYTIPYVHEIKEFILKRIAQ